MVCEEIVNFITSLGWTSWGLLFDVIGVIMLLGPTGWLAFKAYILKNKNARMHIEEEALASAFNRLGGDEDGDRKDPIFLGIVARVKLTPWALLLITLGFIFQFVGSLN